MQRNIFPSNTTFKELIEKSKNLTFLVGAGCSIDKPSCQPAGRSMMYDIINYVLPNSEIPKITEITNKNILRFESLVEVVRDNLDKDLVLIDYYEQCNKPNVQHFFLAEMIKQGHFVMTTNFDFLIEHALIQSNIPKDDIIPIITKDDFLKYSDPTDYLRNGKKMLIKIHGSTKNIITKKSTRDSLIATIQAFGSNKEGVNVFQVEAHKYSLFEYITNNRTLIIMGYSGSDDFDIVPTLKVLKNIKNIVWINYTNEPTNENVLKIIKSSDEKEITSDTNSNENSNNDLKKVNDILQEIKDKNIHINIYRMDINTSIAAESVIGIPKNMNNENFSISPKIWLKSHIIIDDEFTKYYIAWKIYFDFGYYDDALRCAELCLLHSEKSEISKNKAISYTLIGLVYQQQEIIDKALNFLQKSLEVSKETNDEIGQSNVLNNIGRIHRENGDYSNALICYEEALAIVKKLDHLPGIGAILNNIGDIYRIQSKYDKALEKYNVALTYAEKVGNLKGKAYILSNIGLIMVNQSKNEEALKYFQDALQISTNLDDPIGMMTQYANIGKMYFQLNDLNKSLDSYKNSLIATQKMGLLNGQIENLEVILIIYKNLVNYPAVIETYQSLFHLYKMTGNNFKMISTLVESGVIHNSYGKYSDAMKILEKALQICEKSGIYEEKIPVLYHIGVIYQMQQNLPKAFEIFEKALELTNTYGDLTKKSTILDNMGAIYQMQQNIPEAIKCAEEILSIMNQLGTENTAKATMLKQHINNLRTYL